MKRGAISFRPLVSSFDNVWTKTDLHRLNNPQTQTGSKIPRCHQPLKAFGQKLEIFILPNSVNNSSTETSISVGAISLAKTLHVQWFS